MINFILAQKISDMCKKNRQETGISTRPVVSFHARFRAELRDALAARQFRIVYQPKVWATGAATCCKVGCSGARSNEKILYAGWLAEARGCRSPAWPAMEGLSASTISRMEREGAVVRLARGLYQLPDASVDTHHTLAEAAKLVPKGVICLTSALAFHELIDQVPAKVWIAIGPKEWLPRFQYPPVRFVRFTGMHLSTGVEHHVIEGVEVPVFGVAKTIADLFRYRGTVGIGVALEGLRETLRKKKVTPAQIAKHATNARVWKVMEPYMSTLTSHLMSRQPRDIGASRRHVPFRSCRSRSETPPPPRRSHASSRPRRDSLPARAACRSRDR